MVRVTADESGEPIAGAEIFLYTRGPASFDARGTTDEEGRAEFLAPPGPLRMRVNAEGRRSREMGVDVPAEGGDTAVAMERCSGLAGRVVDAETGQPIAGVAVRARGRVEATTGADGAFRLEGLLHAIAVSFRLEGWIDASAVVRDLRPGVVEEREFPLERGVVVSGRVVDARGDPVAGAFLETDWRRLHSALEARAWGYAFDGPCSDEAGAFRLTARPGEAVRIFAATEETAGVSGPFAAAVGAGVRDVVIRLRPPLVVTLRIVDERGEPVAAASASPAAAPDDPFSPLPGVATPLESNPVAGKDGRIRLVRLVRGSFEIRVAAPGFVPRTLESADFLPAPPAESAEVEVALRRDTATAEPATDEGGSGTGVEGRLLAPDGSPVPFATVLAIADGRIVWGSARDGRYRVDLTPGTWWILTPTRDSWPMARPVRVEVGRNVAAGPDIRLPRRRDLVGVVVGPDGPLAGAYVLAAPAPISELASGWWRTDLGAALTARTDAYGHFRLARVGPGTWTVHACHLDALPALRVVEVPDEGELPETRFDLAPAAIVDLEIRAPASGPFECRIGSDSFAGGRLDADPIAGRLAALRREAATRSGEHRRSGDHIRVGPFAPGPVHLWATLTLPVAGTDETVTVTKSLSLDLARGLTPAVLTVTPEEAAAARDRKK